MHPCHRLGDALTPVGPNPSRAALCMGGGPHRQPVWKGRLLTAPAARVEQTHLRVPHTRTGLNPVTVAGALPSTLTQHFSLMGCEGTQIFFSEVAQAFLSMSPEKCAFLSMVGERLQTRGEITICFKFRLSEVQMQ